VKGDLRPINATGQKRCQHIGGNINWKINLSLSWLESPGLKDAPCQLSMQVVVHEKNILDDVCYIKLCHLKNFIWTHFSLLPNYVLYKMSMHSSKWFTR